MMLSKTLPRETWLDFARGLAIISMVVAHTCPVGGIFNVSEYLSAPWFSLLMGCGMWLAWHRSDRDAVRFGLVNTLRGVSLILIGYLAGFIYNQIVVVLQALGVTSIIVCWLVPLCYRVRWVAVGIAVVTWFITPFINQWVWTTGGIWPPISETLAGPYRLSSMLTWMLLGVSVTGHLKRADPKKPRFLLETGTLVVATGIIYILGRKFSDTMYPYSGSRLESGHNAILALGATWACVAFVTWLPQLRAAISPIVDTGKLSLTAYILQLVILRFFVDVFLAGGGDDHWWVMLSTIALLILFSVVWTRLGLPRPIEQLIRWPSRIIKPKPAAAAGGA